MVDRLERIGEPQAVVQIDEAKFGRRKYNRGRVIEGQWVLGGDWREHEEDLPCSCGIKGLCDFAGIDSRVDPSWHNNHQRLLAGVRLSRPGGVQASSSQPLCELRWSRDWCSHEQYWACLEGGAGNHPPVWDSEKTLLGIFGRIPVQATLFAAWTYPQFFQSCRPALPSTALITSSTVRRHWFLSCRPTIKIW